MYADAVLSAILHAQTNPILEKCDLLVFITHYIYFIHSENVRFKSNF